MPYFFSIVVLALAVFLVIDRRTSPWRLLFLCLIGVLLILPSFTLPETPFFIKVQPVIDARGEILRDGKGQPVYDHHADGQTADRFNVQISY